MSILGMNLQLKTKTFGGEISFLDSQQVRYVRGGVTVDAASVTQTGPDDTGFARKILPAGTILGKITASGKYKEYDKDNTDGSEVARCILAETIDCYQGDVVTTAIDHARIITARLPVAPDATAITALKGILFV